MIGIIDYGMGNLISVKNALDYLGEENKLCRASAEIDSVDKIILPGVGAFPKCVEVLNQGGFFAALNTNVIDKKKPILGICLGMQVMAKRSYEFNITEGLGWFDAEVIKMEFSDDSVKIPNIGWEQIEYKKSCPIFKRLNKNIDVYLVHSYYMKFNEVDHTEITATYNLSDLNVTAAIQRDHIFGTQFHPERSSDVGMRILENFIEY